MSGVEYRDCPGFPGYRVGSDGSVWSCRTRKVVGLGEMWHKLSPGVTKKGRVGYVLCRDLKTFNRAGHRLVLEAFVGPRPPGMECLHANGVASDNRLDNLRWGTRAENDRDKARHGTTPKGERAACAKLADSDIPEIRRLLLAGVPSRKIAESFGVQYETIHCINTGKTWKHIPFDGENGWVQVRGHPKGVEIPSSKLGEADVMEIRQLSKSGMSNRKIAALKGVTHPTVGAIIAGETWKHVK